MKTNHLAAVLSSVARRMRADFDQSIAFQHRGESGAAREALVRDFCAGYLPSHIEAIHSGEVIAAEGAISPQCDIVIADRGAPAFTDLSGYRIVPSECVYGVIEVKTKLNREQLFDACEKIRRVRGLGKVAFRDISSPIARTASAYGKVYPYYPTAGMVFAFDSVDPSTLGDHLAEWCKGREPDEMPDSVWVLGKGFFQWLDPDTGQLDRGPKPGSGFAWFDIEPDVDVLFPLALHLNIHFAEAWMNAINLLAYAGKVEMATYGRKWAVES